VPRGRPRLGPRRIDHADKADEDELRLERWVGGGRIDEA
jgi:hypothetical protein